MSNKKLFMIKKLWTDLNSSAPVINLDLDEVLGYYYFKFQQDPKKLNRLITSFDENGVPLNSAYIDVEVPKLHYYPISIGQYGLSVFHTYLDTSDVEKRELFLRIANWFYDSAISDGSGTYWLTDVSKPEFNVTKPWKSAFTQSRAISILTRAYQITNEQRYYDIGVDALKLFSLQTNEGGVRTGDAHDVFYEEYVAEKPTRILDGAMFSLFGLYDMIRVSQKNGDTPTLTLAQNLFDDGVNGLEFWLPKFDMGYWVYYNRCDIEEYPTNDPCTIGYLKLVCAQLTIMQTLSNKNFFGEYKNKFASYLKVKNILKMYQEKYKALKTLNRI